MIEAIRVALLLGGGGLKPWTRFEASFRKEWLDALEEEPLFYAKEPGVDGEDDRGEEMIDPQLRVSIRVAQFLNAVIPRRYTVLRPLIEESHGANASSNIGRARLGAVSAVPPDAQADIGT